MTHGLGHAISATIRPPPILSPILHEINHAESRRYDVDLIDESRHYHRILFHIRDVNALVERNGLHNSVLSFIVFDQKQFSYEKAS